MKTLVLGGLGFVGRHFVTRLVDGDAEVTVVDDMSSGRVPEEWESKPRRGHYAFRIVYEDVRKFFREKRPEYDTIIHCAAVVGGRLKIEGDPLAVATDLAIDADFFNWIAHAPQVKTVVYFSSSAVYPIDLQGRNTRCALSEALVDLNTNRFGMPDKTYGWAKLTGEYLARQAVERYGKHVVIYRPFSGYGEDQSEDYPFPSIMRRVAHRENPITVWGSGEQTRDFIHVDDIVECVLQTMNTLPSGSTLNLGSGHGVSFNTLARMALDLMGDNTEIAHNTTKPEGVFCRVADTYRLSPLYQPKIPLQEGIRRALDFWKNRP